MRKLSLKLTAITAIMIVVMLGLSPVSVIAQAPPPPPLPVPGAETPPEENIAAPKAAEVPPPSPEAIFGADSGAMPPPPDLLPPLDEPPAEDKTADPAAKGKKESFWKTALSGIKQKWEEYKNKKKAAKKDEAALPTPEEGVEKKDEAELPVPAIPPSDAPSGTGGKDNTLPSFVEESPPKEKAPAVDAEDKKIEIPGTIIAPDAPSTLPSGGDEGYDKPKSETTGTMDAVEQSLNPPEAKAPEVKTPEVQAPEAKTPEVKEPVANPPPAEVIGVPDPKSDTAIPVVPLVVVPEGGGKPEVIPVVPLIVPLPDQPDTAQPPAPASPPSPGVSPEPPTELLPPTPEESPAPLTPPSPGAEAPAEAPAPLIVKIPDVPDKEEKEEAVAEEEKDEIPKSERQIMEKITPVIFQRARMVVTPKKPLDSEDDPVQVSLLVRVETGLTPFPKDVSIHQPIAENEGELFVFDRQKVIVLNLKKFYTARDFIFIDEKGKIIEIRRGVKNSDEAFSTVRPAKFLLQVPEGGAKKYGIRISDAAKLESSVDMVK